MWLESAQKFSAALAKPDMPVPPGIESGKARFDVYRNNVAVSLSEALAETFPVVKRLVGDEFFTAMAQIYVQKNQPASPVLFEYGQTFSTFIDTFEPAGNIPYLGDIARLERLWLDAYHAKDALPIGIDKLAQVPGSTLDSLKIGLHPSAGLIRSAYPVISIWQAHQNTEIADLSTIQWQGEQGLIIRPALEVSVIPFNVPAVDFMTGLMAGRTLGDICDALLHDQEQDRDFDPSQHLADIFNTGAVVALDHSPTRGSSRS
ncbi:DNA-binding domain-containing protein [Thalassospiraceae bacterium LMO-JJ14]|nr:DNA-binding domain-containing protein [Thalassospiraceae bacterium LMO-JJ14]